MQQQDCTSRGNDDTGWPMTILVGLASFGTSGLVVGSVECAIYCRAPIGVAWLTHCALVGTFGLACGLAYGILAVFARRFYSGLPVAGFLKSSRCWFGHIWLFFMAFISYPLFYVAALATSGVADSALGLLLSSLTAVVALAAAIYLAAAFTALTDITLRRARMVNRHVSPILFWTLSFPCSWIVVPFIVLACNPKPLAPVGRFLFPGLVVCIGPILWLGLRGISRRMLRIAACLVVAVILALLVTTSVGWVFSRTGLADSPFTSFLFDQARKAADLDGDGFTLLFDAQDCDEGNASINAWARDVPENGVDEDCDGADATRGVRPVIGDARPFPFAAAKPYNIIVVVVDALRADHIHFMGYPRETTPNLDRLAQESLVFTNAIAQSSCTGSSVPSMLSGVYPQYLKWGEPVRRNHFPLENNNDFVADVLRRNGYTTHAVVNSWITENIGGLAGHFDTFKAAYSDGERWKYAKDSSRLSVKRAIELRSASLKVGPKFRETIRPCPCNRPAQPA